MPVTHVLEEAIEVPLQERTHLRWYRRSDRRLAGFSLPPFSEQDVEEPSLQQRFRECTVSQVVGQHHFAEQNIDNSVDVFTSPTRSVAANVDYDAEPTSTAETKKDKTNLLSDGSIITDNLSDEEFAQALVPLDSAISQYLGHLRAMNDQVSSRERTLKEKRCQIDSWDLNKCTEHERRQLENEFASISNDTQCDRDKIEEIKSVLSSVLRQRQCLLDDRAPQRPVHSKRRRLS